MLSAVKNDIEKAFKSIKWFSSMLSERIRVEIATFRLLYKTEELKKRKEELLRKIGEEAFKSRDRDRNIFVIPEIIESIKELESIEQEIGQTIKAASEMGNIET
ncbi:MAG: hypothetical protein L0Y62_01510 [Nitrospirae bacterium]|nr:hypothetical protein [Nitrospirota bacterium]